MNVGIKYCGGCQSKYDRSQVLKYIIKKYPRHTYEFVKEKNYYDIVIVIYGCEIKCADISKLRTKWGYIYIDNNNFKEILKEKLKL